MIRSLFKKSKIEVFVRYCFYSNASAHKNRFSNFSHEKCFDNLLKTADFELSNFTFLLDVSFQKKQIHFIQKQMRFPVIEIEAGEEGKSFLALLDYVVAQNFSEDTILYFLEDDYLHKKGWTNILMEGFSLKQVDYLTLFDHRDKYFLSMYQGLQAQIFHTPSCHWRTTPSTTNTYAMRCKTLIEDIGIHRAYSLGYPITKDHEKFLALHQKGRILVSSLPGWATHCEPDYASPCCDWSSFLSQEAIK